MFRLIWLLQTWSSHWYSDDSETMNKRCSLLSVVSTSQLQRETRKLFMWMNYRKEGQNSEAKKWPFWILCPGAGGRPFSDCYLLPVPSLPEGLILHPLPWRGGVLPPAHEAGLALSLELVKRKCRRGVGLILRSCSCLLSRNPVNAPGAACGGRMSMKGTDKAQ